MRRPPAQSDLVSSEQPGAGDRLDALCSAQCGVEAAQNSNPLPQPTQRHQVTDTGRRGGGAGLAPSAVGWTPGGTAWLASLGHS